MKCVNKHYLSENKCLPVNPNCKTNDFYTGACTSCYQGYQVQGRDCIIAVYGIDQPNCKVVNGDRCK